MNNFDLMEHPHLKPAPPPPPAPKSPAISRARALTVANNAIQEIIDRADGKPGTALLLLAQIRVKRALENL